MRAKKFIMRLCFLASDITNGGAREEEYFLIGDKNRSAEYAIFYPLFSDMEKKKKIVQKTSQFGRRRRTGRRGRLFPSVV